MASTVALSLPASTDVKPGDTLQFTNDTSAFASFEVMFLGAKPTNLPGPFTGTSEIDILITEVGEFDYKIRHFGGHGGRSEPLAIGVFSIRSCIGGC